MGTFKRRTFILPQYPDVGEYISIGPRRSHRQHVDRLTTRTVRKLRELDAVDYMFAWDRGSWLIYVNFVLTAQSTSGRYGLELFVHYY